MRIRIFIFILFLFLFKVRVQVIRGGFNTLDYSEKKKIQFFLI